MIDHLGISVKDFEKSRAFYAAALKPLGYVVVMEFPNVAGMGVDGKPDFWFAQKDDVTTTSHIAIAAKNRAAVNAFYDAAIAAGAKDNGGPGLRAEYHPNYYGAFVIDLNGHNLEAVCHGPE